jgi:hypothetical protein
MLQRQSTTSNPALGLSSADGLAQGERISFSMPCVTPVTSVCRVRSHIHGIGPTDQVGRAEMTISNITLSAIDALALAFGVALAVPVFLVLFAPLIVAI